MCNICEGNELLDAECLEIKIEGNKLKLDYDAYSCDSSFNEEIEIKFCMNCGRKLKAIQPRTQRCEASA